MSYHGKHDRRVFVLEQVKRDIDFSTAKTFGEITLLFGPDDRRTSLFDVDQFVDDVASALKRHKFNPGRDYFCVAGGQVSMSLALVAFTQVMDHVDLLLFHARDCKYVESPLRLRERKEETHDEENDAQSVEVAPVREEGAQG